MMMVSLANPGSPESSTILHIKRRDADLEFLMGVPEFEPFVDALRLARIRRQRRETYEHFEEVSLDEGGPGTREVPS